MHTTTTDDNDEAKNENHENHFTDINVHKRAWDNDSITTNSGQGDAKRWCNKELPNTIIIDKLDTDNFLDFLDDDDFLSPDLDSDDILESFIQPENDEASIYDNLNEIVDINTGVPEDSDEEYSETLHYLEPCHYDYEIDTHNYGSSNPFILE